MARKKVVVITGAAGFLGSHLCDWFIENDHRVMGMDNLLTGNRRNVQPLLRDKNFKLIHCDVSKPLKVNEPVDYVLHFASPASPVDYLNYPIETLRAGSLGTLNTLELAKRKKARFMLSSTSEVYGDPQEHPQKETYWGHVNPIGPRGVYDEAKRFAEAMTIAYRSRNNVDTRIIRIFNTYGPRMRVKDGRVVPNFIHQALRNKPLTVQGDGLQTRSFCYYTDMVEGITKLLFSRIPGPVNIGNPDEFTILELAKLVMELSHTKSKISYYPLPADDPKQRRPDITLAKTALGWAPKVHLSEGIKETLAWFQAQEKKD